MKEKITIIISLVIVAGLYVNHQSQQKIAQSELATPQAVAEPNKSTEATDVLPETLNLPEVEHVTEACNIDESTTNNLKFSDAFTYYRNCLGFDQVFSWNGNKYTTFLAEEVMPENMVADSSLVEKITELEDPVVAR